MSMCTQPCMGARRGVGGNVVGRNGQKLPGKPAARYSGQRKVNEQWLEGKSMDCETTQVCGEIRERERERERES